MQRRVPLSRLSPNVNNLGTDNQSPHFSVRAQTADKGTEHEKRKYSYYKVKNFGENFPEIFIFFIFFRSKRTSAHSTQYSYRLGSSCGVPVANEVSNGVVCALFLSSLRG